MEKNSMKILIVILLFMVLRKNEMFEMFSSSCDPNYLCSTHAGARQFRKQMGFSSSKKCKAVICKEPNKNIHEQTQLWLKANSKKTKKEGHCPTYYRVFDKTTGSVSCSKSTGSSTSKTSNNSQVKYTSKTNKTKGKKKTYKRKSKKKTFKRISGTSNQAKHFRSLYSDNCIIPCSNRCSVVCNTGTGYKNPCCKRGRPNMEKSRNKCKR